MKAARQGRNLLRTTAYVSLLGLVTLGAYVLLAAIGQERIEQQDLDNRAYVYKQRFRALTTAFDEHFRVDEDRPLLDTAQEIPWSRIEELFPPDTIPGLKRVLRVDFGLADIHFKLAWTPLTLTTGNDGDTNRYTLPEALMEFDRGGAWRNARREAWQDDYQDSPFLTWGRYLRDMEVRRHPASDFEKLRRGDAGDPKAEVFSWESELKVMHDQTILQPGPAGYTLMLVARCVSEPVDIAHQRFFQHRICLFLRYRDGERFIDLLDDKVHYSPDSVLLPFCMRGADFGNLCPPSCDSYELPKALR